VTRGSPLLIALLLALGPASAPAQEQLEDPADKDDWDEQAKPPPASQPTEELGDPADRDDWDEKARPTGEGAAPVKAPPTAGTLESPVSWGWDATLRMGFDPGYATDVDGNSEDMMVLRGLATARLQYKPRTGLRLMMSAQLIYRMVMRRSPDDEGHFGHISRNNLEPRIQDTFVELSTSWLDATVGFVTTVWGANTLINPNDQLSVRDLRDGPTLDPDDLRIPSPTLKLEAYRGDFRASLVWLPGFKPNQVDMFGSDYAFFGPGAGHVKLGTILEALVDNSIEGQIQDSLLHSQMPRMFNGSIIGTRVSYSTHGWDLAAQFCYAMTRTPLYRLRQDFVASALPLLQKPFGALTGQDLRAFEQALLLSDPCPVPEQCGRPIESSFRRYHQVGLSVTKPIWKLVASLDISYSDPQPYVLGGPTPFLNDEPGWFTTSYLTRVLFSNLGLQYTYGESLQLTLEGWHELQIDYLELDAATRPPLLLGGPNRAGAALLARYSWARANLVFELAAYAEILYPGVTLIPQVTYRIGDHLRIFAGATVFDGRSGSLTDSADPGSSTGALLDPNDQVYVGITGFL